MRLKTLESIIEEKLEKIAQLENDLTAANSDIKD